jgi:PAS domain S-box-containing protein
MEDHIESFLAVLTEHSLVVRTDRRGVITFANDKLCRATGFDRRELVGMALSDLGTSGPGGEEFPEVWESLLEGRQWQGELWYRAKSGDRFWVHATLTPVFDRRGVVVSVLGVKSILDEAPAVWSEGGSGTTVDTILSCFPAAIHETKLGPVWQMLFVSPYIETITGYPAATFVGNRGGAYSNLIHPEDYAEVLMTILGSVERDVPYVVRYRLTHASGEVRWILERGARSLEDGKIVGAMFDITEEVDLRQTLEGIKTGLDATTMLAFADRRGIICWANEKFSEVSQFNFDEIAGQHFSFLGSGAPGEGDFGAIVETISAGTVWKGDLRCRRKDGSVCWLETTIAPITEEGRIKRYLMFQNDVTADRHRKEIDEKVSVLRMAFIEFGAHRTSFFERLLAVVLDVTAGSAGFLAEVRRGDDDDELRILAASPQIRVGLFDEARATLRGGGPPGPGRLVVPVTYGGRIIAALGIEGRAPAAPEPGREHGVFFTAIAEMMNAILIEAELERQKTIGLQNARLASIGQLASGVGHEINNPLAIINGYAAIARDLLRDRGRLDPDVEELFQKITGATTRISNIVRALKTFAKSDEGQQRRFDVVELLNETVAVMSELVQKDGIDFRLEVPAGAWAVTGNRGRLQQVLVNLMSNARDAVRGRPGPRILLRFLPAADRIRITVADNGVGIPERIRDRIFDPFFTTKEVNVGTGIGLSLVSSIVKEHGGAVEFQTEEDVGTTFTVTLPAPGPAATPGTILVLEDEAELREVIGLFLAPHFTRVLLAATGGEALALARREAPDLVLSDILMPDMDGVEFYRRLTEQQGPMSLRFFFITGGIDPGSEIDRLVTDHRIPLIAKPFTNEDLVEKLKG